MGAPQSPDEKQYAQLEAASAMQAERVDPAAAGPGGRTFTIALPRQGVALLTLGER